MGFFRRVVLLAIIVLFAGFAGGDGPVRFTEKPSDGPKLYGNATVKKILKSQSGYSFRCDIKGWPAIVGEDISVRIGGVAVPEEALAAGKPTVFFNNKLEGFIKAAFANADGREIRLQKIRRGESFSLVADVYIGDERLSELLIENGLAQRYAGVVKKIEEPKVEAGLAVVKEVAVAKTETPKTVSASYVASKTSKVFHRDTCRFARSLSENKKTVFGSGSEAAATGRRPCKTCKP